MSEITMLVSPTARLVTRPSQSNPVFTFLPALGHDKAQSIIDQITSAYESGGGPPPGGFGFGPQHLAPSGPGFVGPPGFGGPPGFSTPTFPAPLFDSKVKFSQVGPPFPPGAGLPPPPPGVMGPPGGPPFPRPPGMGPPPPGFQGSASSFLSEVLVWQKTLGVNRSLNV